MSQEKMLELIRGNEFAAGLFISWCVWVSVSIFNQRQEIALLKQILRAVLPPEKKGGL